MTSARVRFCLAIAALGAACTDSTPAFPIVDTDATADAAPVGSDAGDAGDVSDVVRDTGAGDAAAEGATGVDAAHEADAGGDAAEGGAIPLSCSSYCNIVVSGCTGTFAPYPTFTMCESECAAFTVGDAGDASASGNSLACRQSRATTGQPLSDSDCLHAGPTGGGVCGSRCEAYCQLTFAVCTADNRDAVNPFATPSDCLQACQNFTFDPGAPEFDSSGKNSLNCRQYYLQNAWSDLLGGSAHVNCPFLGVTSEPCAT